MIDIFAAILGTILLYIFATIWLRTDLGESTIGYLNAFWIVACLLAGACVGKIIVERFEKKEEK